MARRKSSGQNQRLRKQPRMRRVESTTAARLGRAAMPKAARRRQKRNNRRIPSPLPTIKLVVWNARWISLALLAMSVYALTMIGMDENFYLTVIPVNGITAVPATEIVSASGLAGAHVFGADPDKAAEQITAVPGVISATVTLEWPNQVSIEIGEEKPIAIWRENGETYWITANGRLIPARAGQNDLLIIESELPPTYNQTAQADPDPEAEPDALPTAVPSLAFIPSEVLDGALQLRELRPNITQLYYRPSSGLSYQDGRGWRAYFGSGTEMAQNLVVYEAIVSYLEEQGLTPEYISVSNQEKPYYRVQ